ncbi:MAG: hypothetical protein RIR18_1798 [Pseudomonadota bacterium]|jgi:uncharacterized membrane protein
MDQTPSVSPFPFPPQPYDGRCRAVEAGACFDWLRQGWAMFTVFPAIWLTLSVIFAVIVLSLMIVPLVGQIALYMLLPILIAGMLQVCQRITDDETPEVQDLFVAFRRESTQLIITGLLNLGGTFAVGIMLTVVASGSAVGGILLGAPGPLGLGAVIGGMMISGLFAVVLLTLLMMSMWFAPALVYFHHMQAWPAIKASFQACAANWLPFLLFGLISLVMTFFALLPLGMGLLILLPVMVGSLYAAYRDIFVAV